MYKNIVFDFGNVLGHFNKTEITRCYLTDEKEVALVVNTLFGRPKPWDLMDADKMSISETKEYLKECLPEPRLYKTACRILDNWMFNIPVFSGALQLIKDLKAAGARIFLISNINMTFADRCMEVPALNELFSEFDGLVFSAKEAICKPSPEIFERFLKRYSLNGKDCIFIDDTKENHSGATAAGMDVYLFDGDIKKLRSFLLKDAE